VHVLGNNQMYRFDEMSEENMSDGLHTERIVNVEINYDRNSILRGALAIIVCARDSFLDNKHRGK